MVNKHCNELDALNEALDEGPHNLIPNPHFRLLWRRYVHSDQVSWDVFFRFLKVYLHSQFGFSEEDVAREVSEKNQLRIRQRLDSFPSDSMVCSSPRRPRSMSLLLLTVTPSQCGRLRL